MMPRYITNGNTGQAQKARLVGEQSFGPYGEQMAGTFNGKTLPSGYRPLTGYTGHLNEDLTGLIYMKGRYYSPLWHRFINSDQGVDPYSINQYAYVNGRPFMAKDPSGLVGERVWITDCIVAVAEVGGMYSEGLNGLVQNTSSTQEAWTFYWVCSPSGGGDIGGGGSGDIGGGGAGSGAGGAGGGDGTSSGSNSSSKSPTQRDIDKVACEAYKALATQFGGIPTGQTEAGAKLYIDNGKVKHSSFVEHTAPKGKSPSLQNVLSVRVPGIAVGYIHTHPGTYTQYLDGQKILDEYLPSANVSEGDIFNLYGSFPDNRRTGYLTTPEFWKSNKVISFQTKDGISASYKWIDCNKL